MKAELARVLVAFGSRRGGTRELAEAVARALRERGFEVTCLPVAAVRSLATYDAVVIGGALYAGRWPREARRFVARYADALRARPVWMFSSGPLDDSAARRELPATAHVAKLMARIGARGHATFGGRLAADATGFLARMMAKTHAGDWRDWRAVTQWSDALAQQLAEAPRAIPAPGGPSEPEPATDRWTQRLVLLAGATLLAWSVASMATHRAVGVPQAGCCIAALAVIVAALRYRYRQRLAS